LTEHMQRGATGDANALRAQRPLSDSTADWPVVHSASYIMQKVISCIVFDVMCVDPCGL